MYLRTGKLDWRFMNKLISILPVEDIDLIMGPAQGEDAAIIRIRDGFLVIHSDPITTGVKRAGYLAIHVAGNDIAVRGVMPRWFLPVVLFPATLREDDILEFFKDMNQALRELNGIVVGGHTEVTPGINRPIVSVTAIGYTDKRVILTRDAKPGDLVYIIGRVGGEGAGIAAWDFEKELVDRNVDVNIVNIAKKYIYEISVVKPALKIKNYVNTMHDATEGGILQALREVAIASKVSITMNKDSIKLEEPVAVISKALGLDPLKLLSSGCIVATIPPLNKMDFEHELESMNLMYSLVGVVESGNSQVVIRHNGLIEVINEDVVDEIYKLWS
ncbi:MAG: AIR synthase-related protein [Desulfurococcaceae archaeon]